MGINRITAFGKEWIFCFPCEEQWSKDEADDVLWRCPDCDESLAVYAESRGCRTRLRRLRPSEVEVGMLMIAPGAELGLTGTVLAHDSLGGAKYRIALSGHGVNTYKDGDILINVVDGSWMESDLKHLSSYANRK